MKTPIYLDYAATTPVDPKVAEQMMNCMTMEGNFGNPASRSHMFGWQAEEAVENARQQVANAIHADPREIVWTSGATEAINLAIKGVAQFNKRKGKHIVTSRIEHKAVLDTTRQLERDGYEVTYLTPDEFGVVTVENLKSAFREDTTIVSLMHVNNELGTVNDIKALGALCRENKILFHVDAAQAAGKVPINVEEMNIDLLSMSGHKCYGPKGVGALYVRRKPRVRLEAQIHGGGHERGMRSGTLPTHQIVGIGAALEIACEQMAEDEKRIQQLRERLQIGLNQLDEVKLNGHPTQNFPGILNVSFSFVEGESLLMALKDMAVSSGSACTSASLEPSYVLRALGLEDELAHSSIRFSIGRYTTEADVDYVINQVKTAVTRLREMSPLWDMHQDGIDLSTVEWSAH